MTFHFNGYRTIDRQVSALLHDKAKQRMVDIVYILTNEAMPGLIKIGCTNGELASRIGQLYSTGVPLPFELFYACEVSNCSTVESKLHDAFGDHRISKGRENTTASA